MEKKKKIHKLIFDFETDFYLIAIASHENDYRLTWALNKALNLDLKKGEDLSFNHSKHKVLTNYSMYNYQDESNYLKYNLISNKSEKGFLIPDLKNIDFILRLSGSPENDFLNSFLTKIKKIDIVITAFIIDDLLERYNKMFVF